MPNLTRPSSRRGERPFSSPPGRTELDALRSARRDAPPLPGLAPQVYARGHAAFEARSDQRRLIAEHLGGRLAAHVAARGPGPVSVLSVGCGDGSLDAALATGLLEAHPDRSVRYVGVEPYAASAEAFLAALDGLDGREGGEAQDGGRLTAEVHVADFAGAPVTGRFDVVTFVHSMYYVRDVVATLRAAHDLLAPGGELVVLSAPRAELNALATVLAPPADGHSQWFSEDVARALVGSGLPDADVATLGARLDLEDASDDVLDFTVQAALTAPLRAQVRAYLRAVAEPPSRPARPGSAPAGCWVAHPVDVYGIRRAP